MRHFIVWLFLIVWNAFLFGQNCDNIDATGNPENITVANRPSNTTFKEMVGVTNGREWDVIYGVFSDIDIVDFTKVTSFSRIFHEMQRDYARSGGSNADPDGINTPRDNPLGPLVNARHDNWSQFYGMNDNYQSYRQYYRYYKDRLGADFKGFMISLTTAPFLQRSFPVGWYTNDEWGGGPDPFNPNTGQIKSNAKNYIKAFAKTYCPKAGDTDCPGYDINECDCMLDVLEIGNEPWGYINVNTYRSIIEGVFQGLNEYYGSESWPFNVVTGALQARTPRLPNNDPTPPNGGARYSWRDYMGTYLPCDLKDNMSGINIHPYSFDHNGFSLNVHPEYEGAQGVDDGSELLAIKNAAKWLELNMPGKDIYVTEYGWDSRVVGNKAQMAYIIRSTLMFSRYGVDKAALYEGLDSDDYVSGPGNKMGLFESCGLWETGANNRKPTPGGQKPSFRALEKLRNLLGDKIFLNALNEKDNGAYAYVLGDQDGKPTHLVAWYAARIDANATNLSIDLPNSLSIRTGPVSKMLDDDISNNGLGNAVTTPIVGSNTSGNIQLKLTTIPVLIPLNNPSACRYLANGELSCGDPGDVCDNDDQAPAFSNCPADISLETIFSELAVNWAPPTATDNCTFNPTITASHSPGQLFPIGSTVVTYEAKDEAGNSNTCSFTVTITKTPVDDPDGGGDDDGNDPNDEDPITVVCPNDLIIMASPEGTVVVNLEVPTATSICQDGGIENPNTDCGDINMTGYSSLGSHGGNQYFLSPNKDSWMDAKEACASAGGHLVCIGDQAENEFLKNQLVANGGGTAFIGLYDHESDGNFVWISGETPTFENWSSIPGNNNDPDGVYMGSWTDGPWYTANQWVEKPYVCEFDCNSTPGNGNVNIQRVDNGPANGTEWPVGVYDISYTITDGCGNKVNCSFTVQVEANPDDDCSDISQHTGFEFLGNYVNNKYFLSTHTSTWENAKGTCEGIGGQLAEIGSAKENEFLREAIEPRITTAFIGLSDRAEDANFQWYTSGNPLSFTNWSSTPRNNGEKDYVYLGSWTTGPWYYANHMVQKNYICEFICGPDLGELEIPEEEDEDVTIIPKVFPNPTYAQLQMTLEGDLITQMVITNANGFVVMREQFDHGIEAHSVDVSQWPVGIYFISLTGQSWEQSTHRFLKLNW